LKRLPAVMLEDKPRTAFNTVPVPVIAIDHLFMRRKLGKDDADAPDPLS
jgi:hypothetical protein